MSRLRMISAMALMNGVAMSGACLGSITIPHEPPAADALEIEVAADIPHMPNGAVVSAAEQVAAAEAKRARKNARRIANVRVAA